MKHAFTFISIAVLIFALYSLLKAQSSAIEYVQEIGKEEEGGCANPDKYFADNPDYTDEEYNRLVKCNKERAARLGLDKPGTHFLGNTRSRPAGALAHYRTGSGPDTFTVFDDYIKINIVSEIRPQETEIPYSRVTDVGLALWKPNSIYIEFLTEDNNKKTYTLTLIEILRMKKSVGARDVDRLVELIKNQEKKHQAETSDETDPEKEQTSEEEEKIEQVELSQSAP